MKRKGGPGGGVSLTKQLPLSSFFSSKKSKEEARSDLDASRLSSIPELQHSIFRVKEETIDRGKSSMKVLSSCKENHHTPSFSSSFPQSTDLSINVVEIEQDAGEIDMRQSAKYKKQIVCLTKDKENEDKENSEVKDKLERDDLGKEEASKANRINSFNPLSTLSKLDKDTNETLPSNVDKTMKIGESALERCTSNSPVKQEGRHEYEKETEKETENEKKEEEEEEEQDEEVNEVENKKEITLHEDEENKNFRSTYENTISDYEKQRLERIRKNEEFLHSLGLASSKPSTLLSTSQLNTPSLSHSSNFDKRQNKRKLSKAEKSNKEKGKPPIGPIRKSTRLSRVNIEFNESESQEVQKQKQAQKLIEEEEEEEFEVEYFDSKISQYVIKSYEDEIKIQDSKKGGGERDDSEGNLHSVHGNLSPKKYPIFQYNKARKLLYNPDLKAIYSLSSSLKAPHLLAAGGKGGIACIFDINTGEIITNFKAHSGWICDIYFVENEGQGQGQGNLSYRNTNIINTTSPSFSSSSSDFHSSFSLPLLTAANDGIVCLWDPTKTSAKGFPKLLAKQQIHSKGIFSMHLHGLTYATGSKDASVCHCEIHPSTGSLRLIHQYKNLHLKTIKAVRIRDTFTDSFSDNTFSDKNKNNKSVEQILHSDLLASGGDDSLINIVDFRMKQVALSRSFCHQHPNQEDTTVGAGVHSIRWHPVKENIFISAGNDPYINVWDLRKFNDTTKPLHQLTGHTSPTLPKYKAIHHPEILHFVSSFSTTASSFSDSSPSSSSILSPLSSLSTLRELTDKEVIESKENGIYVISSGERSNRVVSYDIESGAAVNQGRVDQEFTLLSLLSPSLRKKSWSKKSTSKSNSIITEREMAVANKDGTISFLQT